MMSRIGLIVVGLVLMVSAAMAQSNAPIEPKKANARAATEAPPQAEQFDGASIERRQTDCGECEGSARRGTSPAECGCDTCASATSGSVGDHTAA